MPFNILYCLNSQYQYQAWTSIISILENNKSNQFIFHIFHDGSLNLRYCDLVSKEYQNCAFNPINVERVGRKFFSSLYLKTKNHISAYYRLLVFVYLSNLDRVLYLDSDIICNSTLEQLYNANLNNQPIGAVKEFIFSRLNRPLLNRRYAGIQKYFKQKFNFNNLGDYFNSGVMLFDLSKIKNKENEFLNLMEIARKNNNYFHDQNVLNIYYKGKVAFLDPNWNVLNDLRSSKCRRFEYGIIKEYQSLTPAPKIYHFTPTRPWLDSKVDHYDIWAKYSNIFSEITEK